VDLVKLVKHKEHKCTSACCRSVSLGSVVDLNFGDFGYFDLFFDFYGDLLGVLEIFNKVNVFENVALRCS